MYHQPVMLPQCLDALQIDPEGIYVDATFGGGGHSLGILERIKGGRLIAFDQDEDAKKEADKIDHRSFTFCKANFRYLKKYLKLNGITEVNGILADLGISSHQIDAPERGFSTRFEGPLDMRMDRSTGSSAETVVMTYPEEKLHKVLGMYGELKNARTAAKEIVAARKKAGIKTTMDLKAALKHVAAKGKENKYFAQVFQALRIEVNDEMKALEDFLHQSAEVMAPNGRLVIMSYHSLEDRMVKTFLKTGKAFGDLEKDFYGNPIRPFEQVAKLVADDEEVRVNKRARSARLRVGVRNQSAVSSRQ